MIEQLVKFYKSDATTYNFVFRFMKIRYYFLLFSFILFCMATLFLVSGFLFSIFTTIKLKDGIIIFSVSISFFAIMICLLNNKAKSIVRRKYKIKSSGWMWRTREFDEMQLSIIVNYLKNNNLYNESKIKLLIEILNKEIERRKLPSLIAPGIFISLFLPIWVQFLSFKYKTITMELDAISVLIGMTSLVLIGIFLFNFSRWVLNELLEAIWKDDTAVRRALIEKLEDILIQFPLEEDSKKKVNFT